MWTSIKGLVARSIGSWAQESGRPKRKRRRRSDRRRAGQGDGQAQSSGVPSETAESEAAKKIRALEDLEKACTDIMLPLIPVVDEDDPRVVLLRGKKVRLHMHTEYDIQRKSYLKADPKAKLLVVAKRQGLHRLTLNPVHTPYFILASPSIYSDSKVQDCIKPYLDTKAPVQLYVAEDETLTKIRGFRRSAENRLFIYSKLGVKPETELSPPILVLCDVMNSCNLGAIARTALNLGITSILLTTTSFGTLNDTALRTSTYALLECSIAVTNDLVSSVKRLRERGIATYCGENAKAGAVQPISPARNSRWALVVGNEMEGVPSKVINAVENLVTIPQSGGDSFGVAHASIICLYELSRNMRCTSSKKD